ncbi:MULTISPECIES: hypothetical protein [unclassified Acinetobacter]|uniref:hypothetical protein n=1 Tax=unclassified Acinetobacter TaxID=196816 RepID=UPI001909FC13|nr:MULTISPECIES: hypothetical protein [unclassified Acinetobacter]MBK0062132.1 hypothetical protein [Acinetobacter sp. S55]MBK0065936.1 hypothetical protein [Acinetobacter sp. S54]
MIWLSILSALKRFFYVCIKWILENKRWVLIIILLICCLFQSCQVNKLAGQIKTLKQQHTDSVTQQQLAAENSKVQAAQQERRWAEQITKAEQNYNVKIKQIQSDASAAQSAANSLSKQLSIAKQRLSSASRETVIEYADSSSDILESCITEYRNVAQKADEHAADAERLSNAWPLVDSFN